MATVEEQVRAASGAIDSNIALVTTDRGFLSQNVLQYLRDLVEGLIVWAHVPSPSVAFNYQTQFDTARDAAKASARFRLLARFHGMLQISVSHYTLDRDPSERLMLKYYEYLLRTRDLAKRELGIEILQNLEQFPLHQDPALTAYYEQIAARIDVTKNDLLTGRTERYYINSSRPFFIDGRIYYEVTFSLAHNRTSKFDRVIGFTDIDVTNKYAAKLELASDSIDVLGQTMPIIIIRSWSVSIRPCEVDNFARLVGQQGRVQSGHVEYRNLMQYLTSTGHSLLDLIDLPDAAYDSVKTWALTSAQRTPQIFPVLDAAREIVRRNRPGTRLLRYLMLRMNNQILKAQYEMDECGPLSNLHVSHGCRPFDAMPFCTSPRSHNPRFVDLAESIDSSTRKHELLARRVRNNVEQHGMIYTPETDLDDLGDIDDLISRHNNLLPPTARHAPRKLQRANGHVFITGYEDDTVSIIEKLQEVASEGIDNYTEDVQSWLDVNSRLPDGDPKKVDDSLKANALKGLFARSKVALIYGAAGTGKSTMVNHIANYFENERKLFLAHTNPAVDNLKRRVDAPNTHFSTIAKHVRGDWSSSVHFDVVVIDECSTVGNASFLQVLENTSFDLLVLVGDVYQIESIEFGNWFGAIRSYIPQGSVHELTHPFRTTDQALLTLWDRVRKLDDSIEESLAKNGYSKVLGASLFARHGDDEIVLCLNYDGLYGINNVNRFLQASNPSPPVTWGEAVYKVGDPVLFNETDRFRPVIFNNMRGKIVDIDRAPGRITFDVDIERDVTAAEVSFSELRLVSGSVVQFDVFERGDTDADDDTVNTLVPFQIAYAVSIHKAQGLEYDSVKVVITDANEENISHSIFYTAITRARKHLEVYWTPETEKRILSRLEVRENTRDENLLRQRRGVQPVAGRPKRQKMRQAP
ncbi:ATP-dependent DNA helicase [Leucobacter triazinivorans]|uniref:Helicase n=1 Tax=Leucobacter triazinivorans TaxID=1784719 RepID=A0A4P6KHQ4_9MICO|nr:ATP-dependent RecD-like DNA helicase [Leucobacter triazinivorans]QBE49840.1 helicase [Leucobacter triazinivorans]